MALGDGKAKEEIQDVNKELGYILDAVSSIGDQLINSFQDAVDGASNLNNVIDVVGKTMQRGLVADLKKSVENTNSLIDLQTKVTLGIATQKDISKESEKIALNRARLEAKTAVLGDRLTNQQKELLAQEEEQLNFQEKALQAIQDKNTELQKQKSFYQVIKENTEGIADKLDKTGTLSKILSGNVKDVVTPLRLAELAAVALFNALKGADQATGELAKSFGTSYKEASNIRVELNTISNLSGDVNMTTEKLGKSLMALNKEFGTATMMSGELLTDFTNLTNVAGYSAEAAAGLARITVATGTDLSDNTAEILGTTAAYNGANKLALNGKEIAEQVAKTSAATTLTLGMQPGAIAKAVIESKALGASMAQVEQIASSLLNFESSIENEMSAELLLGKNLNLEKARTAALNGDIATVASEIAKQTGSAADFAEKNVIQQEALAKAVGMSREDLARSLMEREALVRLGKEDSDIQKEYNELKKQGLSDDAIANKLGDETLARQLKSQSVQERFNATIEKLREIFVSIADPIMQIISPIINLLIPALSAIPFILTPVFDIFKGIGGILTGSYETLDNWAKVMGVIGLAAAGIYATTKLIVIWQERGAVISAFQAAIEQGKKAGILSTIGALTVQLGIQLGILSASLATNAALTFGVGVAIAVAAAAAGYAAIKSMKDGEIDPSKGPVITGEFGSVQLDPNDKAMYGADGKIKVGTNLLGNNNQSSQIVQSSPSIDITPLIERMSAVEGVLMQIFNKETNIYLDSTKVGTGFSVATVKVQ